MGAGAAVSLEALPGLPEIRPGDDLAGLIAHAAERAGLALVDGDVLAVAQKVVSKAEGRIVRLADVTPDDRAQDLAQRLNKDPRKVAAILAESAEVIRAHRHERAEEGTLICRHTSGVICANAGVDESNAGADGTLILLPEDADASARELRHALQILTGHRLGVVITDTFGRPWRLGQVNVAIGSAGVPALMQLAGSADADGRALRVTAPAFADEIAAAAGLAMAKHAATPVILLRGLSWTSDGEAGARDLLRPESEDLFR
jgi:coenzyme F420-0:L-glutamate ligase/coenzyme F420-1:gamma-L-glutamate ligase